MIINGYMEALKEQKLSRCPNIITRRAGDESYDMCSEADKECLIQHGHYECETWNEIQKEWLEEDRSEKPYPSFRIIKGE